MRMNKTLAAVAAAALLLGLAGAGGAADGKALYAKCAGCHGADGSKVPMNTGKPVKGMSAAEAEEALKGYKAGTFGGEKKAMMVKLVQPLSDEEIKALAEYIATL
jgi:cytochrome c